MVDEASWSRIARYALGEGDAVEAVETRAWIEADPGRSALARELIALADAGPTAVWNAHSAWGRFGASVGLAEAPAEAVVVRSLPRPSFGGRELTVPRHRRWLVGLAAAAAIAIGTTVAVQLTLHAPAVVADAAPMRTVTTQRGQTADAYLSDGTHVSLGAETTLRFPATFTTSRDVYLEGEAYFDVAHDQARVFSVHTARAIARDIGTKFNVRAYRGSGRTEVVVAEGVVALKPALDASPRPPVTDSLILTRADLGRLDEDGGLSVTRGVDVAAYVSWMRRRLVFADAPLRDVLPQLDRWFDLDITLGTAALAHERLTTTLDVQSPAEMLKLLAVALDVDVERHGRTVVLRAKPRGR